MRDNFLIDAVVNRPHVKAALEGSNLPAPKPPLDVTTEADGIETADTVEELQPLESATPAEEKEELIEQLKHPEGDVEEQLFEENKPSQEKIQDLLKVCFEDAGDLAEATSTIETEEPRIRPMTWEELQAEIAPIKGEELVDVDKGDEIAELREITDMSTRVEETIDVAAALESATPADLAYLNIGLRSFARQLDVPVPTLESIDGKVSTASVEALRAFNTKLRRFALDTYGRLTAI